MSLPHSGIHRFHLSKRHSRLVAYGDILFLAGITAIDRSGDLVEQTREVFAIIDRLLAEQGSQRTDILSAQVWLKDISKDFGAFNEQWEAWMPDGHAPARAVVEAKMAAADILVEVMITAARP